MAENTTYLLDVWADYSMYHNSSHERGFVQSARFGIFVLFCNFFINAILILTISCRHATRSQYIYSQIINLAVSDISYSILVDIVTIYYEYEQWKLGTHVCKAWMILDVIIPFISFIIIINLNIDRLIFALRPSLYYRLFRRWIARAGMILFPWILSSLVLTPLWLLPVVQEPYPEFCIYGITSEAGTASSILSLFLPAIIIIILTVFVLVTIIGGMPNELGQFTSVPFIGRGMDKRTIKKRHRSIVTGLCLVNLSSIIMQLPFGAISMLQPQCMDVSCEDTVKMMQALSWLRSVSPGIRPLSWFLIKEVRETCDCCSSRYAVQEFQTAETTDQVEMASAHTGNEQFMNSFQIPLKNDNSMHAVE